MKRPGLSAALQFDLFFCAFSEEPPVDPAALFCAAEQREWGKSAVLRKNVLLFVQYLW
jgi:hypothetical protein